MHCLVTDRTFSPCFIRQGQIMEDTGPAVNMATTCHLRSNWGVQADWTRQHFGALQTLKENLERD